MIVHVKLVTEFTSPQTSEPDNGRNCDSDENLISDVDREYTVLDWIKLELLSIILD